MLARILEGRLGADSPGAFIQVGDGPGAETKPFLPRALPVLPPRAQLAALAGTSTVQEGLASAARNCTFSMRNLTHPWNCHLSRVQCVRPSQFSGTLHGAGPCWHSKDWCHGIDAQARQPLLWTYGQYVRFRTITLGVGPRHGRRLLSACPRTSASASGLFHAGCPFSASMVPPRKSPRRARLALSHGCCENRENRKRHHRPGRCQLLIMGQAMNLPIDEQNTRCLSTTLASIALNAVGSFAHPQRFGSGASNSSPCMLGPAKP